jgi:putative Holliday junction resolvase
MALDVGDKTVGVAVSDELGLTANPLTVIRRGASEKADLKAVVELIEREQVSKVVVGIPTLLDGTEGIQAGKVRIFRDKLARRIKVPVVDWDESMTTVEAEDMLLEFDVSRQKRRKIIDKVAAANILQSYLAAQE